MERIRPISLLLLGIMAGSCGTLVYFQNKIVHRAGESLALAAEQTADKLDRTLYERYGDIRMMARAFTPEMSNVSFVMSYLLWMEQAYAPFYRWLGVTDARGTLIASTDPMMVGQDRSSTRWFQDAPRDGKIVFRDAGRYPEINGASAVSFTAAIVDEAGHFQGVIMSLVDVSALMEVAHQPEHPYFSEQVQYLVLDHGGSLLASIPSIESGRDWNGVLSTLQGAPAHYIDESTSGMLIGYAATHGLHTFRGAGWSVLARAPRREALAPVFTMATWAVIGTGLLLPTFTLLFWTMRRLQHTESQLADAQVHLEERVEQRTQELRDRELELRTHQQALTESEAKLRAFAGQLEHLVAERTEALRQSEDRLRWMANQLSLAEHRERKRLATDLHDHLQQLLVLGKLKLGQGKRLADPMPRYAEVIQATDQVLSEALEYTRTLVAELSPTVLREHGLIAGLKWLGEWMQRLDLTVTVETQEDTLPVPEGPALLLFQSVRELLLNAAKHAKTDRVWVSIGQQQGALQIVVKDNGAGFDPTTAMADDNSSKFGLFSIRERMRALGGRCDLVSTPGQGTMATLTLPMSQTPISPVQPTASLGEPPVGAQEEQQDEGSAVRVLVVDDHIMVRQGLRAILESYPDVIVVGEAGDGEEAVSMVRQLHPSVVIMDINMPKMNGIEATALITTQFPDVIVIGLSVNADADNQDAMRKAGAVCLLTKEAAVEQLHNTIKQTVAQILQGVRRH